MATKVALMESTLDQIVKAPVYDQLEHAVASLRGLTNGRWPGLKRLRVKV